MRIAKIAVVCIVLIVGAYAIYQYLQPQIAPYEIGEPDTNDPTPAAAPTTTVACQGNNVVITNSTKIPALPNIDSSFAVNVDSFQCGFDAYSWDLFMALNHDAQGEFITKNDGTPAIWELWAESSDIFLKGGVKPPSIGDAPPPRHIPEACQKLGDLPVVTQLGKRPDVLEEFTEPFKSGPLIDANGYYSRFAISVNKPMYDYILNNGLYSKEGQKTFSDAGNEVSFSCSCNADKAGTTPPTCAAGGQQGAVMVKAAWKVIDAYAGDNPDLYHSRDTLVYTEFPLGADGKPIVQPTPTGGAVDEFGTCVEQTMGLTGFHIAQKNHGDTQWLWSTFEHNDNVPTQGANTNKTRFNYFIPDCDDCNAVNNPPAQPWNPHIQPVASNGLKSQIERVIAIEDQTKAMNAQVQDDLLAGTVWQNYELISTQWPTAAATPGSVPEEALGWCTPINEIDKSGNPAPAFLGNTTLETYIQGTVPQASSSCINCHLNATMTDGQFSDFTYLLERAQGAEE